MCSCDEAATSWPTCARHAPRSLIGHTDFRYISLQELCDVGERTEAEVAETRWEQHISSHDFDSPWKDAA